MKPDKRYKVIGLISSSSCGLTYIYEGQKYLGDGMIQGRPIKKLLSLDL